MTHWSYNDNMSLGVRVFSSERFDALWSFFPPTKVDEEKLILGVMDCVGKAVSQHDQLASVQFAVKNG